MLVHANACQWCWWSVCQKKGFSFPACENMKTMRRILTENLQRLAALQHLPRYQEYLALGDEVCAALSFQDYHTIKFRSQPKDLDEDLLKSIVGGVKKVRAWSTGWRWAWFGFDSTWWRYDEEVALKPFCESSDTDTFDSRIVDRPCGELDLVHSSSSTARVQTIMTGEIREV